jgi:hypothetical protein
VVVVDGAEGGGDDVSALKRKRVNSAAKGAEFERKLADYFVTLGYADARRMIRTGTTKHADEGDLDGLPFTVQAKTWKAEASDAQLDRWHDQARDQARTRGHVLALLVVKRNGHGDIGKSWVYIDALSVARLVNPAMSLPSDFALCQTAWWTGVRVSLRKLSELLVISYPPS